MFSALAASVSFFSWLKLSSLHYDRNRVLPGRFQPPRLDTCKD